jgi:hypothetical protein
MAQQDENNVKNVQSPFGRGTPGGNAFREAYNRLKQESEVARGNIGRDYAGAYQQLRQQTYGQGLGAAAQSGFSGGQANMMRNRVSAGQMQALGGLLQGQESAMRQQKAMEGSIFSNALLEGQQAQQIEMERQTSISSILGDKKYEDLTTQQKTMLRNLGYRAPVERISNETGYGTQTQANNNRPPEKEGFELVLRAYNGKYVWFYRGTRTDAGGNESTYLTRAE